MIFSESRYPPAELGCSRVLPLSMAQVGNIRLAHSGVPEFCHCQWRKSETSDLRTRVFPSSAIINGASRKHPICGGQARGQAFSGSCSRRHPMSFVVELPRSEYSKDAFAQFEPAAGFRPG